MFGWELATCSWLRAAEKNPQSGWSRYAGVTEGENGGDTNYHLPQMVVFPGEKQKGGDIPQKLRFVGTCGRMEN